MAEPYPYNVNRFESAEIESVGLDAEPDVFARRIDISVDRIRNQGLRMIWLEIPVGKSGLIAPAVEAGFRVHHARAEYVMLVMPLKEGVHVPDYATHYIGIGGVVVDAERRVLTVAERAYHQEGQPPRYKLPGGALQAGEDLVEAVQREIREETGVETAFEALVCFRHWHGYRYGKSDIYFVSRLRPLSRDITIQDDEIAECHWMPVEDYLALEQVHAFNKRIVRAALEHAGLTVQEMEGYGRGGRKLELFFP